MSGFELFALLSWIYVALGVFTLWRVVARWRSLWDDELTREDRMLAAQASFALLVPVAVLVHELGHCAAIWAQGLRVERFVFYGYMGAVWHASAGPAGNFAIALAGNAVSLGLGVGALAYGLYRPGHPARNILAIELGRQTLALVLVVYPLLCISFQGDFRTIYDFHRTPWASGVTAAIHAALLGVGYWLWVRRWRPRALVLSGPQARDAVRAFRLLAKDPEDREANAMVGALYVQADANALAVRHLARAMTPASDELELRYLYGYALLEAGDAAAAIPELEAARAAARTAEQRLGAGVSLARAFLATGRVAEALGVTEELRAQEPENDEAFMLWARARAANGDRAAARLAAEERYDGAPDERRQVLRAVLDELR